MTPEEAKAAKAALQAEILKDAKQLLDDKFKELDSIIGGNAIVKELIATQKGLLDAKTVEEVKAHKTALEGISAELLILKEKQERGLVKRRKVSKEGMLAEITKCAMIGLFDMKEKGVIDAYLAGKIPGMRIFTSLKRIDDNGAVIKMTPTLGRKVDNPMSDATSVVPIGSGVPFELTQFEPGLTRVTRRQPFILQLIEFARIMTQNIAWVEQTNIDTGIAFSIAEGGAGSGTYGSFRWSEFSAPVQKIQAMSKITNEMLADLGNAQNEIQTEIYELLALKLDNAILLGTGISPAMKGIVGYAQAFANPGLLSVAAPNNYDAIVAAILQPKINGVKSGIALGGEIINIFAPTEIVAHPADIAQMDLTKDTLTRYVLDQQTFPENVGGVIQKAVAGLRITENIGMTQGKVLVMDASKSHARVREDAEIVLGYNSTDFQDDMVSVKGNLRAGHFIKNNQVNAFVMDTYANIKAAIQAV